MGNFGREVLFIPLNTNHVRIFSSIFKEIGIPYEVLCHDRISEASHFHTESLLKDLGVEYRHFPRKINIRKGDSILAKLVNFLIIKANIKRLLSEISPGLIILCLDNDPISKTFIDQAKLSGIKTVLIQEALIRPYEYTERKSYASDMLYYLLRKIGVHLKYIKYGTGGCDIILAAGINAANVLEDRGNPKDKIHITGFPIYDHLIEKTRKLDKTANGKKIFLYAASTTVDKGPENILFLNKLASGIGTFGAKLIVKLHPRGPQTPSDIYELIDPKIQNIHTYCEIIKEGDDTYEILKRSDVLITISSTIVLEALMMEKECLIANYLAGESRLGYTKYDAVFEIEREEDIEKGLKHACSTMKPAKNKLILLKDELYSLDANSSYRVAKILENQFKSCYR